MECKQCGKKGSEDYRPLTTKYGKWEVDIDKLRKIAVILNCN